MTPSPFPIADAVAVTARVYDSPDTPIDVDEFLPPDLGAWPVSRGMARVLARLIVGLERRSVAEFGAGWSSLVIARALAAGGGGRLTSVEHQPEYVGEPWTAVKAITNVDAALVVTGLRRRLSTHGLLWSYRDVRRLLSPRAPFDLVLIDAPPARYGRTSPLHDVFPLLAPGAIVVLDDAARSGERGVVKRWRATYPGLHLARLDATVERGIAVLINDGSKRRRFVSRAVAGSIRDELKQIRLERKSAQSG